MNSMIARKFSVNILASTNETPLLVRIRIFRSHYTSILQSDLASIRSMRKTSDFRYRRRRADQWQAREFGGFLRVVRPAVLHRCAFLERDAPLRVRLYSLALTGPLKRASRPSRVTILRASERCRRRRGVRGGRGAWPLLSPKQASAQNEDEMAR